MKKTDKILILGSNGMVGSALVRVLKKADYTNLLTPSRSELNLLSQADTIKYFEVNRPVHVFDAAAKVGGIQANNVFRADFIFENLTIQNNVFEACFKHKVEKLLFLGSSCIYPKNSPQPIKEEYLLSGELEPTNEPYAIAKIAGLKMAESFRRQYNSKFYAVMPTNLYGENDYFHPTNSHVIPGLIARMNEAKTKNEPTFAIWGTGTPRREFLYVDDMARACLFVMESEKEIPYWLNIGTGEDISIAELANQIKSALGYNGELTFNPSQPDGMLRKLLDVTKIKELGWKPEVSLETGLRKAIDYYLNSKHIRS